MKMAHLLHTAMEKFWLRRDQYTAEGVKAEKPQVKRMTMAEHVARGHVPHRSDCKACVEGSGRTKPHRRIKNPETAVLSLDVAGPFKEGYDKNKYFLVGTYTIIKERKGKKKPYEEKVLEAKDEGDDDDVFEEETSESKEKVDEAEPEEATDELEEMLEQLMEDEKLVIEELKHEHPEETEPAAAEEKTSELKEESDEEIKQEVETLMMAIPMKSKKGPEVLGCIQEMTIRLER
jgi:hypothetical protein